MGNIRVAIVGVGNCASSLVQGVGYYADPTHGAVGLIHDFIGDYGPADIEFVLAFDTDARKVGLDLSEAIFAAPNCTAVFQRDLPRTGVADFALVAALVLLATSMLGVGLTLARRRA